MGWGHVATVNTGLIAGGGNTGAFGTLNAGELVVASAFHLGADDLTLTDNLSNSYGLIQNENAASGWSGVAGRLYMFYAYNVNGGSCTITNNSASQTTFTISRYSGWVAGDPLDKSGKANGSGTTPSVTLVGVAANALLVGMYGGGGNASAMGSGFTSRRHTNTQNAEEVEDKVDSGAAGDQTVSLTIGSAGWHIIGASFKVGSAAALAEAKIISQAVQRAANW